MGNKFIREGLGNHKKNTKLIDVITTSTCNLNCKPFYTTQLNINGRASGWLKGAGRRFNSLQSHNLPWEKLTPLKSTKRWCEWNGDQVVFRVQAMSDVNYRRPLETTVSENGWQSNPLNGFCWMGKLYIKIHLQAIYKKEQIEVGKDKKTSLRLMKGKYFEKFIINYIIKTTRFFKKKSVNR